MENQENVEYLRPLVTESNIWEQSNAGIALVLGAIMIVVLGITVLVTGISLLFSLMLLNIFILIYSIALFFLLEPMKLREINQTIVKTIDRPIVKEVFVDRPVLQEVIVEKPVYRDVVRDVVRNVYVSSKSSVQIPKYAYLGSLQTKRYHSRNCRLGKLIKRKYKLSNNSKSYFIKKKFKACKICILKKK